MNDYVLTERAEADLTEAYVYGIEHFGRGQALRYAFEMRRIFQLLADSPFMGRAAGSIGLDVRRHEHGAHVILYSPSACGVKILALVPAGNVRRLRI